MATKNDITGDTLSSKPTTDKYRDNWERIFGNKSREKALREKALDELAAESQRLNLYNEEK